MTADLEALIFDTGGTVFDWHSAVTETLADVGRREAVEADWPRLAADWRRASLQTLDEMSRPSAGAMDADMDAVLRVSLEAVLGEHDLPQLATHSDALVQGWRRMPAWHDSARGLARLRERFIVASFTILRTALVIESSRRAGVQWDAIISCEMTGVYKIAPASYDFPERWLDVPRHRIMLVTAHNNDLDAAHDAGYRTAFVRRPKEWGEMTSPDAEPSPQADVVAADIDDLATRLLAG